MTGSYKCTHTLECPIQLLQCHIQHYTSPTGACALNTVRSSVLVGPSLDLVAREVAMFNCCVEACVILLPIDLIQNVLLDQRDQED